MGKVTFHRFGLGIVLFLLFAFSWAGQAATAWGLDQFPHGQEPWLLEWLDATLENWQSEFLQLLSFVVLAKWLIFEGSPQSKDSDEEMERRLHEHITRATGRE